MENAKMSFSDVAIKRLKESIMIKQELLNNVTIIETIASVFIKCLKTGKRIYFFGNGGSAADAQHLAAEIVSKFYMERKGLPAEALSTNTSVMTAIANDYSFEKIFSRQIEASGLQGDIAFGISTSGNSANILEAMKIAKAKNMITVGFTGQNGGKLKSMVDYCFCAPSNDTPRIQEVHITVGHIICEILEKDIFGDQGSLPG
jgi:D-sedoheptulose 7-phosphate isomerase